MPGRLGLVMRLAWRWRRARRAAAAVEFALAGMAIMAFLMAILNLGMLGFSLSTMGRAAQATVRTAAMYASQQYATTGIMTCPTTTQIIGYFDKYGQPPLPSAGTATSSNPQLTINWTNNSDGTGTGEWHGVYLTLAVTYNWSPIGFAGFVHTIPLHITTVGTVMGSFDIPTVVASSCT